jgi:hypothetical protein
VGVSEQHGLPLVRLKTRKRELLIGRLNENYSCVNVESLVLQHTEKPCSLFDNRALLALKAAFEAPLEEADPKD